MRKNKMTEAPRLPHGWVSHKISDIAARVAQKNVTNNKNVLTISAEFGLVSQEEYFNRRVASADTSTYYLMYRGDFAYNKSYSIGYPAGVIRRLDVHESGVVSPLYICFRPNSLVHSDFLRHYFSSGILDDDLSWIAKEGVRNHGLLNVGVADFFSLPIMLPPYSEQRRIAEILDSVDESIRTIEHLIAKYEKAELGVLRQLLEPQERWMQAKVSEVGEVRLGRQRSPEHEHGPHMRPYLRVANVFDGMIDYSDVLNMNFSPVEQLTYGLQPGDLLLNEGQSLELVGRCAIYDGAPGKFCYQNTLVRFRPSPTLLSEFAYYTFKWWRIIGRFAAIAKQTTSIAHLGGDRFACMAMDVPPLDLQQRIVGVLGGSRAQRQAAMGQLDKLRNLKRGLMDDLLTGRVRVPTGEGVAA